MFWIILLLPILVYSEGCHPVCSWICDNPICDAIVEPVCELPNCTVICQGEQNPSNCLQRSCHIECPEDSCSLDSCPMCETICMSPICPESYNCVAMCEPTSCSWSVHKPRVCPRPQCELVCEQPACLAMSNTNTIHTPWISILLSIFVLV